MSDGYLIPVMDTVKSSWAKTKGARFIFCGAIFLYVLCHLFFGPGISYLRWEEPGAVAQKFIFMHFLAIVGYLVNKGLTGGLLRMGIRWTQDAPIQVAMVFYPLIESSLLLRLILIDLIIFLLYIPVIIMFIFIFMLHLWPLLPLPILLLLYFLTRLQFCYAFALDKELGPWQSIKASYQITNHNVWRIMGINGTNSLIILVSILPLGLGLIWSLPYVLVNYGFVYRELVKNNKFDTSTI